MTKQYALLVLPSANRVYAETSVAMTQAELGVFAETVLADMSLGEVEHVRLGGVPYIVFRSKRLGPREIGYLSQLSTLYALFELDDRGEEGVRLRPVEVTPLATFDDDLITIPKYVGKTNELFTKLLLNITVLSSAFAADMLDRRLHVFDPLCGRGTTLNQALMYGYNATGVELERKNVEAYSAFIRAWLKRKRLKHHAEYTPVRRDKKVVGRRLSVQLGASKEAYKAGDVLSVTMVCGDTLAARDFFRPRVFDVIVTDLPYGVQHGSRLATAGETAPGYGWSRKPLRLLREAAPGWVELLRPGGAAGVSWNVYSARRDEIAKALTDAGLVVCEGPAYEGFRHRVDQAIERDVVVARKP
ncbi:MAG TPA: SAM-dependent methyltransferase [Actinopolymorphaceae bacterium]